MAEDLDPSEAVRWLEPPAPGEVHVEVVTGEGVELSPAVEQALDNLARALQAEEVRGYAVPQPPQPASPGAGAGSGPATPEPPAAKCRRFHCGRGNYLTG